jgi:hypothetical protein
MFTFELHFIPNFHFLLQRILQPFSRLSLPVLAALNSTYVPHPETLLNAREVYTQIMTVSLYLVQSVKLTIV